MTDSALARREGRKRARNVPKRREGLLLPKRPAEPCGPTGTIQSTRHATMARAAELGPVLLATTATIVGGSFALAHGVSLLRAAAELRSYGQVAQITLLYGLIGF